MASGDRCKQRLNYEGKMILAPMVKIGTTPMRLLALDYGADIVYTEEIIDFRILNSSRVENKILDCVDYIDESDGTVVLRISPKERGKLVLQIGTADSSRAVAVAEKVVDDIDGLDINMGCPKEFSIKGGMGAALLSHPNKVESILRSLVEAVGSKIPVTCKIRILPTIEATLNLVKVIESTGVEALAVHGRTIKERPNNQNHLDFIQEVVKAAKIPIIANGGSSNNYKSAINTYDGIKSFWESTGASSVMIARAAEWNPSVFRPGPREDTLVMVGKYLDHAIEYDYPFVVVKYNVNQLLGSLQESPMGKKFHRSLTLGDICDVFDKKEQYVQRQKIMEERKKALGMEAKEKEPEKRLIPRMRKVKEVRTSVKDDDAYLMKQLEDVDESAEIYEMYTHYLKPKISKGPTPKCNLVTWHRSFFENDIVAPEYRSWQKDKLFRSAVVVKLPKKTLVFSGEGWEKNKKLSQQAAAMVGVECAIVNPCLDVDEPTHLNKRLKIS